MNIQDPCGVGGHWSRPPAIGRRALLLTGLLLVACGRRDDVSTPPTIRYGQDVCSRCGMIISDPAYAAAYRTGDGEVHLFDDVGEMALDQREHGAAAVASFVHDYESGAWIRAEEARYVLSPALRSPMGFGVVALASETQARTMADRLGTRVLTFAEVQAQVDAPKPQRPG